MQNISRLLAVLRKKNFCSFKNPSLQMKMECKCVKWHSAASKVKFLRGIKRDCASRVELPLSKWLTSSTESKNSVRFCHLLELSNYTNKIYEWIWLHLTLDCRYDFYRSNDIMEIIVKMLNKVVPNQESDLWLTG